MLNGRELPWMLMVALCAAVAMGIAAYALGSRTINGLQISGALVSLAIGQIILFARVSARNAKMELDMRRLAVETTNLMRETRDERHVAADLAAQVSVMRSENQAFINSLSIGMNDMRQSHSQLADSMRMLMSRPMERRVPVAVHPQQWREPRLVSSQQSLPSPQMRELPLPPNPEPVPVAANVPAFAQDLVISLEPVVDLFSSQTAHYRLHHSLSSSTAELMEQARNGDEPDRRPTIDIYIVREAMGLLRRLRRRDNKLGIIMPIGAATLSVHEALQDLVALRAQEPEIGGGLIIDLPHAVLASLPESALEGLAYLARSGVELSLSNASVSGLDLGSLDKLNVRFVGVSSASVGAEPKLSKGIAGFVQAARSLGIQVIVAGVTSAEQATQLMRIARLASGPAFAEPRRVRREVVQEEYSAAAE